jgi:ribosomal-protein-alanine N-acetyltransferase
LIRKFHPKDSEAVSAVAKESPESAQWSQQSYRELNGITAVAWVAEVQGTVAGFLVARIVADQAEILNIAVAKPHRNQGLGSSLLDTAKLAFSNDHVTLVFLEVRESNRVAQQFYQRHGFTKSGFRKSYYQDPREGAVLMEMKLIG